MSNKELRPADRAECWTHHWIGPNEGDQEPWLWTDDGHWARGFQTETPQTMAARGWVYFGPCEPLEVVADLRRRLASAEARLPPLPMVVSIIKAPTP